MDQLLLPIKEGAVLSDIYGSESSDALAPVLLAENLRKSYRRSPAIRDLSFALKPGRVLGFLGPNGAGKTTAIRMLTTILEPDSGYFIVNGVHSDDLERVREQIGVLPESLGFPKQTTGLELLAYFGELNGQMVNEARTSAMALLEEVGLKEKAKSLVGTYSRGMRQRLGIARALINNPVVLFLDEPTLGLDPRGQEELLALIRRIARTRNTGVILCSHQLSEIENICDDVVILMSGQVIASGSVAAVISQAHQNMIRLHVPAPLAAETEQLLGNLPRVKKVNPVDESPGWFVVEVVNLNNGSSPYMSNHVLEALFRAHIPILTYESETGLKDVFLRLTEEVVR
jgi:ABC-2 type transport system ATP-binding protein